jgi:hypothetical protein
MFHRIEEEEKCLDSVNFSDESTFHVSGKVNNHNWRAWGSENPRVFLEYVRHSTKLNVICVHCK